MDSRLVFNPVQHQILNPGSNDPVYHLPAVQEYAETMEKREFQTYVIPTAYDLLPPEIIKDQAKKIFYGR